MNSDNDEVGYVSNTSLLEEADELARSRNCTRDFALYVMYSQAIDKGDKMKAKACIDVLETEIMNLLADPSFWKTEKEKMEPT